MLYDAQLVNQMITDIERIDLNSIGSQSFCAAPLSTETKVDNEGNATQDSECVVLVALVTD